MPNIPRVKGLQSIKSMQNVSKSSASNKEDSDFIKLYLFEKERSRLKSEEIRVLLRLEIIQNRLKEIQSYTNEQIENLSVRDQDEKKKKKSKKDEDKEDWKTMSIDY